MNHTFVPIIKSHLIPTGRRPIEKDYNYTPAGHGNFHDAEMVLRISDYGIDEIHNRENPTWASAHKVTRKTVKIDDTLYHSPSFTRTLLENHATNVTLPLGVELNEEKKKLWVEMPKDGINYADVVYNGLEPADTLNNTMRVPYEYPNPI